MASRVTSKTIDLYNVDHNERKKGHAHSLGYEVSLETVLKGLVKSNTFRFGDFKGKVATWQAQGMLFLKQPFPSLLSLVKTNHNARTVAQFRQVKGITATREREGR